MPTYDYECLRCGHTFEFFQPISAAPLEKCPQCEGPVKRLIGCGAGIIFKGSGFYETDYRRKDKHNNHCSCSPSTSKKENSATSSEKSSASSNKSSTSETTSSAADSA